MINVKLNMRYIHSVATLHSNVVSSPYYLSNASKPMNSVDVCQSHHICLMLLTTSLFLQHSLPLLYIIIWLLFLTAPCLVFSDILPSFSTVLNSIVMSSYSRPFILLIWYPLPSRIYICLQL